MTLEGFFEALQEAPDRRQEWKIKHKMGDIIAMMLMGYLARCDEIEEIHVWAEYHEETLRTYLELPNGIPSYDTMRRVMAIVDPGYLNLLLQEWNELTAEGETGKLRKILSIDGKTQRGNGTSAQAPNHILSAVDENGVCLGQEVVDEKSNEIAAIPELIDRVRMAGQIVTLDAMGTQKEIAQKIRKKRADYVLALKKNQQNLYEDVHLYFEDAEHVSGSAYASKTEKARGGIEKREYWQTSDIGWLEQKSEWTGLKTIGMTRNTITKRGKTTQETRYFISSLDVDAELFARAVRGHWAVEAFHWHLDVTFREDDDQTLDKQAAYNLNILRKFALAILRAADIGKRGKKNSSLKKKRLHISLDPIRYLHLVFDI